MSRSKSQSLLDDILFAPDFELSDLRGLNVGQEWEWVESSETSDPEFSAADGWNKSSVTVRLPKEKEKWADESEAPQLEVPDVYHRSLLDIIKTVCRDPEASSYQWIPYKQFWRRPKNSSNGTVDEESAEVDDICVYSELFNSDAMLLEYEKIHSQPPDPDDPPDTEVAIADISEMGTPADMEHRNILRVDTTAIQNLIDGTRRSVFRKGFALNSKKITKILDPKSLVTTRSAFSQRLSKFGFNFYPMSVPDLLHEFELGVWKAVFTHLLRILYAEGKDRIQILNKRFHLVPTFGHNTIRHFMNNVSAMKQLAARDFEDILQCIIPVLDMLLPPEHNKVVLTLLFELATWHALAKLRLHTEDTLTVFTRTTESLGDSLHAFINTTCEAYDTQELPKEHAARGRRTAAMRERGSVVSNRKKSRRGKGKGKATDTNASSGMVNELSNGPKIKKLNLSTYKLHALANYPQAIRQFGTTDNYSTQVGELEHRHGKRWYVRTNKNKHVGQITKHERHTWLLHRISQDEQRRAHEKVLHESTVIAGNATSSISRAGGCSHLHSGVAAIKMTTNIPLPKHSSPFDHYHMSDYTPVWENIPRWLKANKDDCAFENFIPLLKNHLLSRLMGCEFDGDENEFTPEEHATLKILENKIYFHKVMHVNYTTYDMRRDQDMIDPRTHPDVMVLAHEDDQDHNTKQGEVRACAGERVPLEEQAACMLITWMAEVRCVPAQ
ncbi:hypothetical protein WOLCODRAFT_156133 [Wolfiporia cocos MD-104 SS10]|uniref:Uncharacterized protein n=1 Tax=Wolfiporia cocos (strain MD-104) TaxID=742152 RepID=A0A2H3J181_WOLCO|nr:hypothetical protein WOLCODRAFT_156133 [Wolfiporia cocos MD-104 SS10]